MLLRKPMSKELRVAIKERGIWKLQLEKKGSPLGETIGRGGLQFSFFAASCIILKMMRGSGRETGAHQRMLEAGMVHVIKK